MILVRQEIGDVLRDLRQQQGRTLRQVAGQASVALGYLSEVERGQKEVSSEILASVADALNTPVSAIMREVSDRIELLEQLQHPMASADQVRAARYTPRISAVPDTVPDSFMAELDADVLSR
jgi:transcriptional regulator with XRE-family HTH domain